VTVYRHISAERAHCALPVSLMCELLDVSESGYWAWSRRAPSDRELSDAWLAERIRRIHADSGGTYGSPRVHAELRRQGIRVGRKRVERLMRAAGLEGAHQRRRRKGSTVRVPGVRPAPDLVERNFRPAAPNVLWAADIKRIVTLEGILYLAAVQDLFSRRIVGWSMAGHMRAELVVEALEMAVGGGRPGSGVIHHSDQGSQYVSLAFGKTCVENGIATSMGSRGDCFDNAVAETFFATLTKEKLLHDRPPGGWPTRALLRTAIFDYIERFYNRRRLHSTLGMRSPAEYEADHAARLTEPDNEDRDRASRASARARARENPVHNLRLRTGTTTTTT
jgi:putative transposase